MHTCKCLPNGCYQILESGTLARLLSVQVEEGEDQIAQTKGELI